MVLTRTSCSRSSFDTMPPLRCLNVRLVHAFVSSCRLLNSVRMSGLNCCKPLKAASLNAASSWSCAFLAARPAARFQTMSSKSRLDDLFKISFRCCELAGGGVEGGIECLGCVRVFMLLVNTRTSPFFLSLPAPFSDRALFLKGEEASLPVPGSTQLCRRTGDLRCWVLHVLRPKLSDDSSCFIASN